MAGGGGLGAPAVFLGSDSLKLNCRKNSLVSLFQWDQKRCSDLSTSLEGTWWLPKFDKCEEYGLIDYKGKPFENQTLKAMVSYGSAAKRRYCHFLSGGSTWWSFRTSWVQICKKQTSEQCRKSYKGNVIMNAGSNGLWEDEQPSVHKQTWSGALGRFPQQSLDSPPIIRESINIILCCYCLWFCLSWAHLEQKALLAILCIPLFCNPVARPADLHKLLDIHTLNITHICQNLPNLILLGQLFHVLIRNSKDFLFQCQQHSNPMFKITCFCGAGWTGASAASLAARLARLLWCFLPWVIKMLVMSVLIILIMPSYLVDIIIACLGMS